jgi:hypothetical protein
MGLAIELPRKVIIENTKLGVCQIVLQLIVAFAIGYTLIMNKAWNSSTVPLGSVAYWVESGSTSSYAKQVEADTAADFCNSKENAKYNYFDGDYVYKDYECRELDSIERYLKLNDNLFVRTLVQETFSGALSTPPGGGDCKTACSATFNASDCAALHPTFATAMTAPSGESEKINPFGNCLCECTYSSDFFPKGVKGLTIAIEHKARSEYAKLDKKESVSSQQELYSAVMNADGTVKRWFEPGAVVRLPIEELLDIVGFDLDTTLLDSTTPNVFGPPAVAYPSARVTGMEIEIDISYHNKDDTANKHYERSVMESFVGSDEDKPYAFVAYIYVKGLVKWNSQQRIDFGAQPPGPDGTGLKRTHYMYNMSFRFRTRGSYSYFDYTAIVTTLGIIAIYVQLPNKFMGFVCEYCLGNLSILYKNGIRQIISAERVYAGMTARGLMYAAVFDHLLLPKTKEEGASPDDFNAFGKDSEPTITSKRLEHLILDMLKSGGRIDNMEDAAKVRSLLAIEMDGNTRRKFIDVALNSDLTTLRSVADNFNSERENVPIGEKLFKQKPTRKSQIIIPGFDFD